MRFTRLTKENGAGIAMCVLMGLGLYVYFGLYYTPSRAAWYSDMGLQIQAAYSPWYEQTYAPWYNHVRAKIHAIKTKVIEVL